MVNRQHIGKAKARFVTIGLAAVVSLATAANDLYVSYDAGAVGAGPGSSAPTSTVGTYLASMQQTAASAARLLAEGLGELQGSAVGPDGALFVTATLSGEIWRVNPVTGAKTLYASGFPARNPDPFHVGSGVVDVAFLGDTGYALVTSVGVDFGAEDYVKGIYRIDGPDEHTVIADIGTWAADHLPDSQFFIDTGFQYAIQAYRDGFLVTDGHHNKVLWISADGGIRELIAFGNVVPTGLTVSNNSIYVAQAGPIAHAAEDGKIVMFDDGSPTATEIAAGAPLLVDVEFGQGDALFALSQGEWEGEFDGEPALPDTGSFVRADGNGGFQVLATGLDRPTSLEFIDNSAYIVTLGGEIWVVDDIAGTSVGQR